MSQCVEFVNLMTGYTARCTWENTIASDRCYFHDKHNAGLIDAPRMVPHLTQAETDAITLERLAREWDVPVDWAKDMARLSRNGDGRSGQVAILDRRGEKR